MKSYLEDAGDAETLREHGEMINEMSDEELREYAEFATFGNPKFDYDYWKAFQTWWRLIDRR